MIARIVRRSSRPRRSIRRLAAAVCLATALSAASAAPGGAAVTIGQTVAPTTVCGSQVDRLQPTVTSGNTYVVPPTVSSGIITSWSTQAVAGGGMLAMKVYRPLGGLTYLVVGHEGPHALVGGALNTFPASVAVKAGDVLGLSTPPSAGQPGCLFEITGESGSLRRDGILADGESGEFMAGANPDRRVNISALVSPTNAFTLGDLDRNKKKGTAKLTVNISNPGELVLSGKGLRRREKAPGAAGDVVLKIKANKNKLDRLEENGKVKVKPKITFTPTGGDPSTQSRKLKLRKR